MDAPDYVTMWPDDSKSVDTTSKTRFTWKPGARALSASPKATPELLAELAETGFIDGTTEISVSDFAKTVTGLPTLPASVADSVRSVVIRNPKFVGFDGLFALSGLETLTLELNEIPEGIHALGALTKLEIKSKKLKALPADIGKLPSLTHLKIINAPVAELPEALGQCPLEELELVWTKKLKELPDSLGDCATLRVLRTDKAPIKKLPDGLWASPSLESLTLDDCKLSKAGPSIEWPALRSLRMQGGTFKKWPSSFVAPQLEELELHGKHQALPDLSQCGALTKLRVNAPLASVDPSLAKVEKLKLQCSKAAYAALDDAAREAFGKRLLGSW